VGVVDGMLTVSNRCICTWSICWYTFGILNGQVSRPRDVLQPNTNS
jgi:hypothetical protein